MSIVEQGPWDADMQKLVGVVQVEDLTLARAPSLTQEAARAVDTASIQDAVSDTQDTGSDFGVYTYYINAIGKTNFAILVTSCAAYSFFITIPQYWLGLWTDSESHAPGRHTAFYVLGYLVIALLSFTSTNTGLWAVIMRIAPVSGLALHTALVDATAEAWQTTLFKDSIGSVLNRFGQDIQLVDRELPTCFGVLPNQIFKLLMQAVLLFSTAPVMAVTIPMCMIVIYVVQRFYLRASKRLRFLDLERRSGVATSFLETAEGVLTIRAFGWEDACAERSSELLDASQAPWFLLLCLQRWLNVVLDLLLATIAVGIIAFTVYFKDRSSGAGAGVALNMVIVANATLLKLVENYTNLEISLGAIARLKSFTETVPREPAGSIIRFPYHWWLRNKYDLRLENVTASYGNRRALDNVTLEIPAGALVVIHGRSGSGKSTLLAALLRLLPLDSGTISLANLDLGPCAPQALREKIFLTLPQDPYIPHNTTLRDFLDPDGTIDDEPMAEAILREAGLPPMPFDAPLPPLSTGQTQLLSLVRAVMFRHSLAYFEKRIMLLDEATAALDADAEQRALRLVAGELRAKKDTVVMVCHRLAAARAVMKDGDMLVEMAEGRVVDVQVVGQGPTDG